MLDQKGTNSNIMFYEQRGFEDYEIWCKPAIKPQGCGSEGMWCKVASNGLPSLNWQREGTAGRKKLVTFTASH